MAFICPHCHHPTLTITTRLELPPDTWHDEITLQLVACSTCTLRAAATYEESRHGALNSEAWHHRGYQLEPAALETLTTLIAQCPSPDDPACPCPTHQQLGQTTTHHTWDGLRASGITIAETFAMRHTDEHTK